MSLTAAEKFELVRLETLEHHRSLTHKSDQDRLEELRAKTSKKGSKTADETPTKKAPAKKATASTTGKK